MTVPAAVLAQFDELYGHYAAAWERVLEQERALIRDPRRAAAARRLREIRASIEREMDELDRIAPSATRRAVRAAYAAGAASLGVEPFTFTRPHADAVRLLSDGLTDDLLAATRRVRLTTKRMIREVAKQAALSKTIEGKTATQAAREMAKVLAANGVSAVTYSNGARHGLATYSRMAMRTTTALAYNTGTIKSATEADTKYFEVSDGNTCGWTSHDDGQLANGMIVTAEEALSWPISHPNCVRAFLGRAELRSEKARRRAEKDSLGRAQRERERQAARDATPLTIVVPPGAERHAATLDRFARNAARGQ